MFIILIKYTQPLEKVDEVLPAHIAYLKGCYERAEYIISGPRVPRTGGVILANVQSLEKVWALIKQDPYYIHGIAQFEVIEFTPRMYDDRMECFIK